MILAEYTNSKFSSLKSEEKENIINNYFKYKSKNTVNEEYDKIVKTWKVKIEKTTYKNLKLTDFEKSKHYYDLVLFIKNEMKLEVEVPKINLEFLEPSIVVFKKWFKLTEGNLEIHQAGLKKTKTIDLTLVKKMIFVPPGIIGLLAGIRLVYLEVLDLNTLEFNKHKIGFLSNCDITNFKNYIKC